MNLKMRAPLPEVDAYLSELTRRMVGLLGDALVGVYLHGSAAMNAFVPSRSDVDVLVVTQEPMSPNVRRDVADSLSEKALPCPGTGLELSIVLPDALVRPTEAPSFELHIATQGQRVVHGKNGEGDRDLIAHFAMIRERGIALVGPSPTDVFPATDRAQLLQVFAEDLAWAIENRYGSYAVLNACRALRFAREGVLSSKFEGGAWALENGIGDRATVETAMRRQSGTDEQVDLSRAAAFMDEVREELLRRCADDDPLNRVDDA